MILGMNLEARVSHLQNLNLVDWLGIVGLERKRSRWQQSASGHWRAECHWLFVRFLRIHFPSIWCSKEEW